jgi:Transmembrane amino acid transporter protein
MCAFGIIIGDSLPHVMRSVFPNLATTPVLSLLVNRQFMIALCTLCISYPLSLYRDIHKLARASGLALVGMLIIVVAVSVEGPHVPESRKGDPSKRLTFIDTGIFQAIGVMSFAFGTPLIPLAKNGLNLSFRSLPSQYLNDLRQLAHPNHGSVCQSYPYLNPRIFGVLHNACRCWLFHLHRQNSREHPE